MVYGATERRAQELVQSIFRSKPRQIQHTGGHQRKLFLQESAERLEPGCEYLLWFKLSTNKPVLFAGSLVMLDQDDNGAMENIEAAVGLKLAGSGE